MQQYHAGSNRRPCPEPATRFAEKDSLACALVLAGGEGKRLRPFIHLLRGDLLPKQYVNFIGRRSMLEHTLERAEKLAAAQRVFTVINKSHLAFPEVRRQLAKRSPNTTIMQEVNVETFDTATALLHGNQIAAGVITAPAMTVLWRAIGF